MSNIETNVQQQVPVQQVTFDPSQLRRTYTHSQWLAKEDWYAKECNAIQLTESPSPADIQQAAVKIDTSPKSILKIIEFLFSAVFPGAVFVNVIGPKH